MISFASVGLDLTDSLSHLIIFGGYLVAMLSVAPILRRVIEISRPTMAGGVFFFICCGLTHFGLVLGWERQFGTRWPFVLNDVVQAVAIWTFLLSLYADVKRAVFRLSLAQLDLRSAFYDHSKAAEQLVAEGVPVDHAHSSDEMARWMSQRFLSAFMNTPCGPAPEVTPSEHPPLG